MPRIPSDHELSARVLDHSQVALREWSGIEVFRSRAGPGTFLEHEHPEVQLSARISRPESDRSVAVPRSLSIVESGRPHAGTLTHRAEFLMLYVQPDRLTEEAEGLAAVMRRTLQRPLPHILYQVVRVPPDEVDREPPQRMPDSAKRRARPGWAVLVGER